MAESHAWEEALGGLPLRDVMWGDYIEFLGGVKELWGSRSKLRVNKSDCATGGPQRGRAR